MEIFNRFIVSNAYLDDVIGVCICNLKQGKHCDMQDLCYTEYVNDQRHGIQKRWYFANYQKNRGVLAHIYQWHKGLLHGYQASFDFHGRLYYEATYEYGKRTNECLIIHGPRNKGKKY